MSYNPGGHYAAHHDYLLYPSEKEWDEWMRVNGNRFGTLIMAFGAAESGGATVFPRLGAAVRTKSGDAFFWFNAMGNSEQVSFAPKAAKNLILRIRKICRSTLDVRFTRVKSRSPQFGSA